MAMAMAMAMAIASLGEDVDCSLWSSRFRNIVYVAPALKLFLLAMPGQLILQVPQIEHILQADRWTDIDAWLQNEKNNMKIINLETMQIRN